MLGLMRPSTHTGLWVFHHTVSGDVQPLKMHWTPLNQMSKTVFLSSLPQSVSGFIWRFGGFSVSMVITQKDNFMSIMSIQYCMKKIWTSLKKSVVQGTVYYSSAAVMIKSEPHYNKRWEQGTMLGSLGSKIENYTSSQLYLRTSVYFIL